MTTVDFPMHIAYTANSTSSIQEPTEIVWLFINVKVNPYEMFRCFKLEFGILFCHRRTWRRVYRSHPQLVCETTSHLLIFCQSGVSPVRYTASVPMLMFVFFSHSKMLMMPSCRTSIGGEGRNVQIFFFLSFIHFSVERISNDWKLVFVLDRFLPICFERTQILSVRSGTATHVNRKKKIGIINWKHALQVCMNMYFAI